MGVAATAALALSMSADAFAVSVSKGVCTTHPRLRDAARSGAIFGVVEAIAPLVGWSLGLIASRYIQAFDHWIAFIILGYVGGKLLRESFEAAEPQCEDESATPEQPRIGLAILTAVGTSIDSMAVGVSLAFLPVNIWVMAAAIGTATFTMATLGIMIGHHVGNKVGKRAETAAGLVLIGIGTHILLSHLGLL